MRLVTFDPGDGPQAGLLLDGQVVAVGGAADVGDLLRAGPLSRVTATGEPRELAGVRLLPPVLRPSKIVCIGLNYGAHAAEAGLDPPDTPTFFAKWPNALAAPGAEVRLPSYSDKVDYEAEVAFVIGADGDVAGYTLLNDLSARDYQFKTPQWMPGKVFDGSAPCGPALVTPDEAGPHDEIKIELRLNGEVMQSASTADLVHSIPDLVSYLSGLMTLEPGDIVATGTPSGVGSTREPRVWLKAGDELAVSSPTLGVLETRLA
jgi:acylpyruvate hydrolase